jgi:hypothetical protein
MHSLSKTVIKVVLFSFFVFLGACTQITQPNNTVNSNSKPANDIVVEKENEEVEVISNENYQMELQQHMASLRQMDNKNKAIKKKAEEKEFKEWVEGTWEWQGYIYGTWTWSRLQIHNGIAVAYSPNGILDQGAIRIDMDNCMIYFGKYSYVKFRHNGRCQDVLYFDEKTRNCYRKTSNAHAYSQ